MHVIQIGLGDWGFSWFKDVLLHSDIQIAGLVDVDPDVLSEAQRLLCGKDTLLFTDYEQALAVIKPDFILNTTPPHLHKQITFAALKAGIPVLCEKPIAETLDDAMDMLNMSAATGVPVMIAENYRFSDVMRTARHIIASGEMGRLNSVHLDFQRNVVLNNYHKDLQHPLLLDIAVHHLDLIRYLTGVEARSVYAKAWTPGWSRYQGFSSADLLIDMADGIKVSYRGSVSAFGNETDWSGHWRIEGEKGVLRLANQEITVESENQTRKIQIQEQSDNRIDVLNEFVASLRENRRGVTDIADNIRTFRIVQAGMDSIARNAPVAISDEK